MFKNQVRGLIVIFLILAIIPFIIFISHLFLNYKIPILANQYNNVLTVEIQNKDISKGIYFIAPGTTANQLMKLTGTEFRSSEDFVLDNGMKLIIYSDKAEKLSWARIDNARRLALGMPIDLNSAMKDDLLLIPGIGEITAQKILALRNKKVRFKNIEELMETDGIKKKKFIKLKKYLYLQKQW
jgi:competence protein ComEA